MARGIWRYQDGHLLRWPPSSFPGDGVFETNVLYLFCQNDEIFKSSDDIMRCFGLNDGHDKSLAVGEY